jgi:outer membrane lipoprotein SlyB
MPLKQGRNMKAFSFLTLMLIFTALSPGCATDSTTSTVWAAPGPGPGYYRPGHVAWIREVVHRKDGDPAGGAVAGAIIGGLLGHDGPGMLIGALGGAAVGAAVSQGSAESRTYEVAVQFDDGGQQSFMYGGQSPFRPGQPVVMTPQGLAPMQ